jgi:hypothetical protein
MMARTTRAFPWRVGRVLLAVLLLLMMSTASEAGLLIVSGDGNISNALSYPSSFDNSRWFLNILGGGTKVLVDNSAIGVEDFINDYYNSIPGLSSSKQVGEVTAASLAGVNLFISPTSGNMYSAAEITALGSFLSGGGSILLMAEHQGFMPQITNVNAVLTGLGSSMSVSPAASLCGFNTLTGSQIASNPLNAGVSTFEMGCTSQVLGGTPLFFTDPGFAMIAVEGQVQTVPEPGSSLLLLGLGLVGLRAWRKRLG